MPKRTCSVDGCDRAGRSLGMCGKHYMRAKRRGDPLWEPPTIAERFWSKVNRGGPIPVHRPDLGPCWLWTKGTDKDGYGLFRATGKLVRAHRFAYQLLVGPFPEGLVTDHLCRVHACVNPSHMEPVTNAENLRRGDSPSALAARKTHCIRGHEFTPENTYRHQGERLCRACRQAAQRIRSGSA